MKGRHVRILWDSIETVLLDMDGTLLDRHFEDFFWDELVPRRYATKHRLPLAAAKEKLKTIYQSKLNTVYWGDIAYWEKRLDLRLWGLRYQTQHLVRMHPHTMRFLKFLKQRKKKVYLVTAALRADVDFKLSTNAIGCYFDGIFSEFEIGASKKSVVFWEKLQRLIGFKKNSTMVADDEASVLKAAKKYGIKWIVLKKTFSSKKEPRASDEFISVRHFDDIL